MRGPLMALVRMGTNKGGAGGVVGSISSTVCVICNRSGPT